MDGTLTCFNMLVKKRYPLIKEMLQKMLNWKLEAEAESTMEFELLKFINKKNVDYVALLWEDFMYQADNREISSARKEHMPYLRFTKVIIDHFISKDNTISMRNMINLHTVHDDTLLSTLKFISKIEDCQKYGVVIPNGMINDDIKLSKAYKTYLDYATRKVPPKKARKFKKPASPKLKTIPASPKEPTQKGKDTPNKSLSKNKAPANIGRGKGVELLSNAALLKDTQMKKALKKKVPYEQTDKPKDTNEGTGEKLGVLDVSKDDSTDSEAESKGDSEDESDDFPLAFCRVKYPVFSFVPKKKYKQSCEASLSVERSTDIDLWYIIVHGKYKPTIKDKDDDVSIDCAFSRFNTIITSLKALDESFSSRNHVKKFLRALPTKWRPKVTAIEESKDLSTLYLDELIDNLKVYEVVLEKDLRNDDEYAMAVRDFKKFFGRKGKFVRQPYEGKKNIGKAKEDKEEKCWSDSGDDSKKEEICLMAQSNEVQSDTPYYSSSSLDNESKQDEYDKLCKISLRIINKNKHLKAKNESLKRDVYELKSKVEQLERNKEISHECESCDKLVIEISSLKLKLASFKNSSSSLRKMVEMQKPSKDKYGLGYTEYIASTSTNKIKNLGPQIDKILSVEPATPVPSAIEPACSDKQNWLSAADTENVEKAKILGSNIVKKNDSILITRKPTLSLPKSNKQPPILKLGQGHGKSRIQTPYKMAHRRPNVLYPKSNYHQVSWNYGTQQEQQFQPPIYNQWGPYPPFPYMGQPNVNLESDEWIKDSGCTRHMTGNKDLFSSYKTMDGGAQLDRITNRGTTDYEFRKETGLSHKNGLVNIVYALRWVGMIYSGAHMAIGGRDNRYMLGGCDSSTDLFYRWRVWEVAEGVALHDDRLGALLDSTLLYICIIRWRSDIVEHTYGVRGGGGWRAYFLRSCSSKSGYSSRVDTRGECLISGARRCDSRWRAEIMGELWMSQYVRSLRSCECRAAGHMLWGGGGREEETRRVV
ncbi:hypothetical protein Tco_0210949 [Tanacetum coccineum]